MKLATRLNSFFRIKGTTVLSVLKDLAKEGITHVDFNFPEHVADIDTKTMSKALAEAGLKANGVAMRYRGEQFLNGEFTTPGGQIQKTSLAMAKEACDYCRTVGGEVLTVWLAYDGFDYSFQMNYSEAWEQTIELMRQICDYAPDLKISIEYKPYEERSYALIDSFGTVYAMIQEINRPNIGATLDFCHMLMKHDNPALAADILGKKQLLFGIHLNDGYGRKDDGLMIATSNLAKTLEFLYYVKKHDYKQAIFFDTFPIREPAFEETQHNVEMIKKLDHIIDGLGMDWIGAQVAKNSGLTVSEIIMKSLA